jgi:hypothetical protein
LSTADASIARTTDAMTLANMRAQSVRSLYDLLA